MFVLSPVMNYSPMDALLASDSKPQFDLEAMSPGTLEGQSETHILRLVLSRPCAFSQDGQPSERQRVQEILTTRD